jgi:hypothetical protein
MHMTFRFVAAAFGLAAVVLAVAAPGATQEATAMGESSGEGERGNGAPPDLEGTWFGTFSLIAQGLNEHFDPPQFDEPTLLERDFTLVIDRQDGNRFSGHMGVADGERRDPVLGIIRADGKSGFMVDDDGAFNFTINPHRRGRPRTAEQMEICRFEVDSDSRSLSCGEVTRAP